MIEYSNQQNLIIETLASQKDGPVWQDQIIRIDIQRLNNMRGGANRIKSKIGH